MKTPEEIRKGLDDCMPRWNEKKLTVRCDDCAYKGNGLWCRNMLFKDASTYIQQLESTVSQVSKALCGKENATLDELLQAVDQLKSRLAQAEMERDAAVRDLNCNWKCAICKKFTRPVDKCPHYRECGLSYMFWEWRGPCPENTKEA